MSGELEVSRGAPLQGAIRSPALELEWSEAPWDTAVYGHPVLQITHMKTHGAVALVELEPFIRARDASNSGLVSCRLLHDRLRESMLLEDIGFRFIEMVYQPELVGLQSSSLADAHGLSVLPATPNDLPEVINAAGRAFGNERFHVDPRLPCSLADRRYENWVQSSLNHAAQRLYVVRDVGVFVAFFVVEHLQDGTCYWHLNAVAPELQGKGYGFRSWSAMLASARDAGAARVRTSIVARNHRVLNLYSRLGFSFPPPLMTFHWVRG